jgi:hypothetical protein
MPYGRSVHGVSPNPHPLIRACQFNAQAPGRLHWDVTLSKKKVYRSVSKALAVSGCHHDVFIPRHPGKTPGYGIRIGDVT